MSFFQVLNRTILCAVFLFINTVFSSQPAVVYLTWQNQPETTMTVQWITALGDRENILFYRAAKSNLFELAEASYIPLPNASHYALHRVELTGLKPDEEYIFRLAKEPREYKFLTLPKVLNEPLKFVVGGDLYHDSIKDLIETNKQAASLDPRFAILGGDIAYAANKFLLSWEKNDRWVEFLSAWSATMVDSQGHCIPFLSAIGNHDVTGRYGKAPKDAPFFYTLFPQPGYETLDCGDYLSVFILDSGHTHPIEGAQAAWLREMLEKRASIPHKFAVYHVPAYPSVRDFRGEKSSLIRKEWVPLFEKYGINAVFEHHDHAYKRTFPMLKDKKNPNGVVYLGDGAWGVEKPRKPKLFRPWYLEKTLSSRNFILVTLNQKARVFHAINSNGETIDSFKQ